MFSIWISLKEGGERTVTYSSLVECLDDGRLRALFDDEAITECRIICGGKRVAALPPALISWERFADQVISNATAILRISRS